MHARLLKWDDQTAYIIDSESEVTVVCVEVADDGTPAIKSLYDIEPSDAMLAIWLVSTFSVSPPKHERTVFAAACGLSDNGWSVEHAVTFVINLVLWLQQQQGRHSWIEEAQNMRLSAPQCRIDGVPSHVFAQFMWDLASPE